MFKKKCPQCNKKIEKNYDFCPFCGQNLKSKHYSEDFGFLGKNDLIDEESHSMFGGSFMEKMINNAMRALEKQMKNLPEELNKNQGKMPNMKVRFLINGKEVIPQKTQIQENQKPKKIKQTISKEKAEKFAKLPRKEPKTKMQRLAGKLVYELSVPGVKNIKDVLINQLENSIEVKALSKDKVYSKILNINLPIINLQLEKGSLILELQAK